MNKSLEFLAQIIEIEEKKDKQFKVQSIKSNDLKNAVGESYLIFQLKTLRDLINKEMVD